MTEPTTMEQLSSERRRPATKNITVTRPLVVRYMSSYGYNVRNQVNTCKKARPGGVPSAAAGDKREEEAATLQRHEKERKEKEK